MKGLRRAFCTLAPAQRATPCRIAVRVRPVQASQTCPDTMEEAMVNMQEATKAAIADGHRLIEVEFPAGGLYGVSGDSDGANEMTYSLEYLRKFLVFLQIQETSATTRIFFPDKSELGLATQGQSANPAAGAPEIEPTFVNTKFQLDYLTDPTGLMDFGLDLNKFPIADRVKDSDTAFIAAYPHFNVNEILAVEELWDTKVKALDKPLIVFNGEMDRYRSNYYPPFFYPKIAACGKNFIPQFETAFYIHNFKGSSGGVLFRIYPGPWQVGKRNEDYSVHVVHTQEERPTLKEVALNILPRYQ